MEDQLSSLVWSGLVWLEQFRTLKAISGWMGWDGMDGILLRSLVQLEHLAVLITNITVEPFVADPWCSTITVTTTGKASVKKHTVLGPYKRTTFWSCGKPVRKLTLEYN